VRTSLLAPFTPYVVRSLIAANIIVFAWGVYLGHQQRIPIQAFIQPTVRQDVSEILHTTGSLKATDVLVPSWNYVRLLTCCFVHFGLIHLAVNMLSLYLVGPLLERMWGHVRFLVLYLVAGLGGSCVAVVLKPVAGNQLMALAGASGAIWGMLASMAVWVLLNYRHLPRRLFASWGWSMIIAFAINIAITFMVPGISAEAHFGGGAFGAVCALLLHFTRFGPVPLRAVATAGVAALPVFGLWAVAHPGQFNVQWGDQEKALVKLKETEEKDRDWRDFQDQVMPRVKEMEKEALKHAPDAVADPIINRNVGRRDEERVNQAIQAYGEAQAALAPAPDLLRQAGPYHDADVEKARQVRLDLIEARLDLFAQNKRCLEAGKDWTPQDERKREEAIQRVKDLDREWRGLLR
jgi:membrane associated rhomboid family serine protease